MAIPVFVMVLLSALFIPLDMAAQATFITFDVPGSTETVATSISAAGAITGIYTDNTNFGEPHGFLRSRDGSFTTFDPPGGFVTETFPQSINAAEEITGNYVVAGDLTGPHGFVRAADGTFTTFDAPGIGFETFYGTQPNSINSAGAIAGTYKDSVDRIHGFLRAPDGSITTFDVPGSYQTFVGSINPAGTIVGGYQDAIFTNSHGFLRAPDGTFTTFDVSGSSGTGGTGINPAGEITGSYCTGCGGSLGQLHGFVRARDGTIITFDAPGAGERTEPIGIKPAGEIVGSFMDANFTHHGFSRGRDGTITTFDGPGSGTGRDQGTFPLSINPAGAITGYSVGFGPHGFVAQSWVRIR
jgi:hypothetical protein